VNLGNAAANTGEASGDTYDGVENATGSRFSDVLTGDAGANQLVGGAGDDALEGGAGADMLQGGDGIDTADYTRATGAVSVDLSTGRGEGADAQADVLAGIENLTGSRFDDVLRGDAGDNGLVGGLGDDVLSGGAGADQLTGGDGSDTASYFASLEGVVVDLSTGIAQGGDAQGDTLAGIENLIGSALADTLIGDAGDNRLDGGAGDDILEGGTGADRLSGGTGFDTADYQDSSAAVTVDISLVSVQSGGDAAGDVLDGVEGVLGSRFDDRLLGNAAANRLVGGAGNDVLEGRAGADVLEGGEGTDTASYATATSGVRASLADPGANTGDAAGDAYDSIENLRGSAFADSLTGDDGDNVIEAGAGNDVLRGGAGADVLRGGDGFDAASYAGSSDAVSIDLSSMSASGGDAQGDTLDSIENVTGSDFDDTLKGDAGANRLEGGGGDDLLTGGAGADALVGGSGTDTAIYRDSAQAVTVSLLAGTGRGGDAEGDTLSSIENVVGSGFNDVLVGSARANRLEGGSGDDVLEGGDGADVLIGGLGSDTASYAGSSQSVSVDMVMNQNSGGDAEGDMFSGIENLRGSAYADFLRGNAGANVIEGLAGDDLFEGGAGADRLDGGVGVDTASYAMSQAAVAVNLTTGTGTGGDAQGDILINVENVSGSDYNDVLTGSEADNVLAGGTGDDRLEGREGADQLIGGEGIDTAAYTNAAASVSVSLLLGAGMDGDAAGDALVEVENLEGSAYADVLVGDVGDNVLTGNAGDDQLEGGLGADTLSGGAGSDTAAYRSSAVAVQIDLANGTAAGGDATGDVLRDIENVIGSGANDTLYGSAGANRLDGGAGNDWIEGGAGADVLVGGTGVDTAAYARSSAGVSVNLTTGQGSGGDAAGDVLQAIENLKGSDYGDTLAGSAGGNVLDGGAGDDVLVGGAGADVLVGGDGGDTASYATASAGVTASLANALVNTGDAEGDTYSGIENLTGSGRDDVLTGDAFANRIDGSGGNDTVDGGAGADALSGGAGTDAVTYAASNAAVRVDLSAGTGSGGDAQGDTLVDFENVIGSRFADVLRGDAGDNALSGGDGNDVFDGGLGADALAGGTGTDAVSYENAAVGVTASLSDTAINAGEALGDTYDSIENLRGSALADMLVGNVQANLLEGGDGDDVLEGGAGADTLNGGAGSDTASYEGAGAGVRANLADVSVNTGDAAGDVYQFIENLTGSAWDDTLTGDANANVLSGGAGNDTLIGAAGNDTLNGGDGNDSLAGGVGNDILNGGAGDDLLEGGLGADAFAGEDGTDTVTYTNATTGIVASLGNAAANTGEAAGDTYSGVENLTGSAQGDRLTGDAGSNRLDGGAGDDELEGGGGADALIGGVGVDTASYAGVLAAVTANLAASSSNLGDALGDTYDGIENLRGSAFADTLIGDLSINEILGGAGDDTIDGGGGNDTITGGAGNDTLTGGSGIDTFIVDAGSDTMLDLGAGGIDIVQVSAGASVTATVAGPWTADSGTSNAGSMAVLTNGFAVSLAAAGSGVGTNGYTITNTGAGTTLTGSRYNDVLVGGTGADTLLGGTGNDILRGGGGVDTLQGGDGNDSLSPGSLAFAQVDGGIGFDVIGLDGLGANTLNVIAARVLNVEQVDLSGASADRISLAASATNTLAAATTRLEVRTDATGGANGRDVVYLSSSDFSNVVSGGTAGTLDGGAAARVYASASGTGKALAVDAGALVLPSLSELGQKWGLFFSPGAVTGNTLWLDGADVDGDGVVEGAAETTSVNGIFTWVDKGSGAANAVQSVATAQPSYVTNAINGNGVVRFDGNDTLTALSNIPTSYTVFSVQKMEGSLNGRTISTTGATGDWFLGSHGGGTSRFYSNGWISSTSVPLNTNVEVYSAQSSTATGATAWLNGTQFAATVTPTIAPRNLMFGAYSNNTEFSRFDLGEVIVYNRILTTDERQTVEAYLQAKWQGIGQVTNDQVLAGDTTWQDANFTLGDQTGGIVADTLAVTYRGATARGAGRLDAVVMGGGGDDDLSGGVRNDALIGGAGSDLLRASAGTDWLDGGIGSDSLDFSIGAATGITFTIGAGAQAVGGGFGTVTAVRVENVTGSAYADVIFGDASANTLKGGDGADILDGGGGADIFDASGGSQAVVVNLGGATTSVTVNGTALAFLSATDSFGNTDRIRQFTGVIGGSGNDTLTGDGNANWLDGGAGADTMTGGAGNDTYIVDSVNDVVVETANAGVDTVRTSLNTYTMALNIEQVVFTGTGNFILMGNPGDSTLTLGTGNDAIDGAGGSDTYVFTAPGGSKTITDTGTGATDVDTLDYSAIAQSVMVDLNVGTGSWIAQVSGIENVIGGSGNDTLTGNSGNNLLRGGLGGDTLDGGAGIDTASYSERSNAVNANLTTGVATLTIAPGVTETDTLANIENVIGTASSDRFTGDTNNNTFTGGLGGSDTFIIGNAEGTDTSTDTITDFAIGANSDVITVHANATANVNLVRNWSAFWTKTNHGVVNITANGNHVFGSDAATGNGVWNISNAGNGSGVYLQGGKANDSITGGSGNDTLDGRGGNDTLAGGLGNDVYVVDSVNDVVVEAASAGTDTVQAKFAVDLNDAKWDNIENATVLGTANLAVTGDEFANTLIGNGGDNLINGGAGNDVLNGGTSDIIGNGENLGPWRLNAGDLATDSLVAPDGTMSADRILASTYDANAPRPWDFFGADIAREAGTYTLSAYFKPLVSGTMGWNVGIDMRATFDAAGQLTGTSAGTTAQFVGDGWWRVSKTTTWSNAFGLDLYASRLGNTGSSIWGVTFEQAATASVYGGGDDTLNGGAGDDTLTGGGGADTFIVDTGSDTITDLGKRAIDGRQDVLQVTSSGATATATLAGAWTATAASFSQGTAIVNANGLAVDLSAIALGNGWTVRNLNAAGAMLTTGVTITGSVYDDTLQGGGGADTISGSTGNDTIQGNGGADTLLGGDGNDRFVVSGGDSVSLVRIDGGVGSDSLVSNGRGLMTLGGLASKVANVETLDLSAGGVASGTTDRVSISAADIVAMRPGDGTLAVVGDTVAANGNRDVVYLDRSEFSGEFNYAPIDATTANALAARSYTSANTGATLNVSAGMLVLPSVTELGASYGLSPQSNWTPASLGVSLALWLDGADLDGDGTQEGNQEGGTTLSGASYLVNTWVDKSGNGRNAVQATASAQPRYVTNAINGLAVVNFDGTDDGLRVNNLPSMTGGTNNLFWMQRTTDTQYMPLHGNGGGANWVLITQSGAGGTDVSNMGGTPFYADGVLQSWVTRGGAYPVLNDKTAIVESVGKNFAWNGSMVLANGYGGGWNYGGDFTEVIVTTNALSGSERQQIEGYLAWKWGTQANLPLDHPFRMSAPGTGGGGGTIDSVAGYGNWQNANVQVGTAGDDALTGTNARAGITGQLDDLLLGGAGNDTLRGGAGNDGLYGAAGNDLLQPGTGNDYVDGGTGVDTIDFSVDAAVGATTGITVDLARTTSQAIGGGFGTETILNVENVIGTAFADQITGDGTDNVLDGRAGNDTLNGGAGNDTLIGGAGSDALNGGTGNDTASYVDAAGAVTVNLSLTTAQDTVGAGVDTLSAIENLVGSAFNDTLTGDGNDNILDGGAGNDALNGGAGNDILVGGAGNDALVGGTGTDAASYAGASAGVTASLAITSAQDTVGAGIDTLSGIESLTGSDFDDALTGDGNDNILTGGAGDDVLDGAGGHDTVHGGDGNDILTGGLGNDILVGGAGTDTASYGTATAAVTVSLALATAQSTAGAGSDTMSGIENLVGSAFADTLAGDTGANALTGGLGDDTLNGGAGNDTLDGGDDNDTLVGGAGNDSLTGAAGTDTVSYAATGAAVIVDLASGTATGGDGSDTLSGIENVTGSGFNDLITGDGGANVLDGAAGNDTLDGGAGNDTLTGGDGNDTLTGGAGNDVLTGGVGIDTAQYMAASSAVVVNLLLGSATGGDGTDGLSGIENVTGSS